MSSQTILLGVNIDHVATVRQARYKDSPRGCGQFVEPDPVTIALLCEKAGAQGITVHPREDARHVQRSDVRRLRECIQTRLNMEMAATEDMLSFALEVLPETICIVPEKREEVTTEGGLEVAGQFDRIDSIVKSAKEAGIESSLFIDPDKAQIEASAKIGAKYVELHTGAYANAYYTARRAEEFERLVEGAALASELGLIVNAGHGINYVNVSEVITIPELHELNIGHSIISRALFFGIDEAVREMKALMAGA
ncbi:pyridoxine 5'-phosphate synthase [Pelagicoccus sp. SDUM812003]|uniref:pyridoxine 5'-phosphate synthase n=1 Tax=Pelagicoccus sp. SDUM812003 TaxID=3041267 RepID=UPI00280E2BD4|nr:pyridoxine 5'-phosphate synthase [Pelagicoccus sp. SDUM812003]MDQ8204820.1 pyridoxine 5'-phosphate synthase [Pelagicoccus sp. SDUM812003]